MISNLDKRIDKIKTEHDKIALLVLDKLKKSQNDYIDSLNDVKEMLKFDKQSIKEYEAIAKTEDVIKGLFNSILNVTSKEDIMKIRNSINYYINKIKKVLAQRQVPDFVLDNYLEKTAYLRNDIASLLRISKRNDKLLLINDYSDKRNNLSVDETKDFRKLLRNENNYNKRNLKKYDQNNNIIPIKDFEPLHFDENLHVTDKKHFKITDDFFENKNLIDNQNINKNNQSTIDFTIDFDFINSKSEETENNINEFDYLNNKANKYYKQYGIVKTSDYCNNNKLFTFIKNIPANMINKSRIKHMKKDYQIYYHGIDLRSYIAYEENRNSIVNGLKIVLSKSFINTKAGKCLTNHEECKNWLYDYCQDNSLKLAKKESI